MTIKELKKYKIVVKSDAHECNLYASENLQKYIKLTCGVNLKVVKDNDKVSAPFFSIGETAQFNKLNCDFDRSTLIHDGFRVFKDENNSIYFDSLSPRGVMYAVFDFIEVELGCRFLTARVEHIPTVKEIDLSKMNRVSIPSFEMGTALTADNFGQGGIHRMDIDFYCKTRTRDLFTSPHVPAKYGGPLPYCARNDFHNFSKYCPYRHVDKHPEWFRFMTVNGQLTWTVDLTNGINEDGTLDETMEESVIKTVISEFKKDIDAHPEAEIFGFTSEDSGLDVDSEKNKKWTKEIGKSGILVRFCNVLVRELNKYAKEKYNKTIKLSTFAYGITRNAPVKEVDGKRVPIDDTMICDENLIIQIAVAGNMYFSYADERQSKENKQLVDDWAMLAKRFWFWSYDNHYQHYQWFFDTFHTINDNMRYFKDIGIEYLFVEAGGGRANWQTQMRSWVHLKKIWNIDLDANALIDEYIDLYYNIVGDKVREFIKTYHDHYKSINEGEGEPKAYFWMRYSCQFPENNPISVLEKALKLTDEMYDIVNKSNLSPELKKDMIRRVAEIRLTPLKMIYNNYYYHYPNNTKEQRLAFKEEYYKTALLVDVPTEHLHSGARWRLIEDYFPEMEDVFVKIESGAGDDGKRAQDDTIPNDVI